MWTDILFNVLIYCYIFVVPWIPGISCEFLWTRGTNPGHLERQLLIDAWPHGPSVVT